MGTHIGPAMPYKSAESYDPASPDVKESRFSGRRYISGASRRLTVAEMRAGVLADWPDAEDIKRAGHSRIMFRVGATRFFRYHATDIATWNPETRQLTLRAHREAGTAGLGWHTPATRNAWGDAIPAIMGGAWTCQAWGAGHNATTANLRNASIGYSESISIIGRNLAHFLNVPEA